MRLPLWADADFAADDGVERDMAGMATKSGGHCVRSAISATQGAIVSGAKQCQTKQLGRARSAAPSARAILEFRHLKGAYPRH
jgi:hypothetical protein